MIVKEIVERFSSQSALPPAPPRAPSKGFPLAKHRSSRGLPEPATRGIPEPGTRFELQLDNEVKSDPSRQDAGGASSPFAGPRGDGVDDPTSLQTQMNAENKARIEAMSEGERRQEAQELVERFGPGLVELMQRRRAERQTKGSVAESASTSTLEVTAQKERPALPRQDETADKSLADGHRRSSLASELPNVPIERHKLAWMDPAPPNDDSSIRFDLAGNILTAEQRESIPTSHGLHHHGASPDLAGYTIDDILVLCRSSVPGQRTKMLNLLGEVIRQHGDGTQSVLPKAAFTEAITLASDILANPPRAIGLHFAAVDLLYRCVVSDDIDIGDITTRPAPHTAAINWEELLPGIQLLLCGDTGLPTGSAERLIHILRFASLGSQEAAEAIFPLLPRCMRTLVLDKPWPMSRNAPPAVPILLLANDLIKSSRGCATAFMEVKLAEPLLRYLIPSTWPNNLPDITIGAMRIFTSLGRYGLNAEILSSSMEIFRDLGTRLRSAGASGLTTYLDLLAAWTTCSIDPHRTTPEHNLTWTQVAGMVWVDEAIEVLGDSTLVDGDPGLTEAALVLLIAWLIGLEINTGDNGAGEKARICQGLVDIGLGRLVDTALGGPTISNQGLLAALVELDIILSSSTKIGILSDWQKQKLVSLLDLSQFNPEARLRYHLIGLAARQSDRRTPRRLQWTLDLFHAFVPSEEHLALSLLDDLLKSDISHSPSSIDLQILRPLLQYTILPSADSIVGPRPPVHTYLKATTILLRPSSPSASGLPLASDWLFSPLNELLHSTHSTALQQTPRDWNPSETEIVRATLVLVKCQLDAIPDSLERSLILFNLMKVYMLEDEQNSNTSDGEVFRDPFVSEVISDLLQVTTTSKRDRSPRRPDGDLQSSQEGPLAPLEEVSQAFLGRERPFFQFYTDFVALFAAISYSDTSFAQLLVPPQAMNYPVDYRRQVWIDHPQLARLVHLKNSQVPLESNFAAYLEPRETDADVLNAYGQALTRGWITKERNEFVWTVAMSHVVHAVWQSDEAGIRLLKSIVNSGAGSVMKEMLSLSVNSSGEYTSATANETQKRLETVERVFTPEIRTKVEALL